MPRKFKIIDKFSVCRRFDDEQEVQNGLSMTPSQMFDMAQKGLPITTRNLGVTYDEGYNDLEFDPPMEYRRGIDVGDLYEARHDVKTKFRKLRDDGRFNKPNVEPVKGAE